MDEYIRNALMCDLRYAIRQLREFGDSSRALDALERCEAVVQDTEPIYDVDVVDDAPGTDGDPFAHSR